MRNVECAAVVVNEGGVVCLCVVCVCVCCCVIVRGKGKGTMGLSVLGVWERLKGDGGVDKKRWLMFCVDSGVQDARRVQKVASEVKLC